MEFKEKHFQFNPKNGSLLISEPFLLDPNFRRTVVLLIEYSTEGCFGFVLNKLLFLSASKVAPGLFNIPFPLFYGGPVEPNTLHFIHRSSLLIPDSKEICKGIFWGGDLKTAIKLCNEGTLGSDDIKFFLGYSGWGIGQLEQEIVEKSWWSSEAGEKIVFTNDLDEMWSEVVISLGSDFAHLANPPESPHWN